MYFNKYNNPHNNLNIAINTTPTNSETFYYYDSISRTFNDFNNIEKEVFLEWLDNHDDSDITCMTDVVDSLTEEIEEDRSRGDN